MTKSETIRICSILDIPDDEPLAVELKNGNKLAVYRIDDEYFVTSNVCTHGNALLSEGWQEGDVIECPFHGGAFFIKTGEPAEYPCVKAIKSYAVTIEDDSIFISLSEAENAEPDSF